jgi:hypothetical protein
MSGFNDNQIRRWDLPEDARSLIHDLCYHVSSRDIRYYVERAQEIMRTCSRSRRMTGDGFEVGDIVTWTSQAHGYSKTKTGKVIEVVEPRRDPKNRLRGAGYWRPMKSYIVQVEYGVGGRLKKLYWPVASLLKMA